MHSLPGRKSLMNPMHRRDSLPCSASYYFPSPVIRDSFCNSHIHRPYVRKLANRLTSDKLVVNTGSVSLPYDGDCRASYYY
jgi:hypothetical protein